MNSTHHRDVIVIGAGLAGLTAAALIDQAGYSSVVVERRQPGGRAQSLQRDGWTLNSGPHALYRQGAASNVFGRLGIVPVGGVAPVDSGRVEVGAALHPLPTSPAGLLRSPALSARGKAAAGRVFPKMTRGRDRAAEGLSLAAWFDRRNIPADLRQFIEMYVRLTTYANDPEHFAADAALAQFARAQGGVWYLDGGWQQLVDHLTNRLSASCSVVVTGSGVDAVIRDAGNWQVDTEAGAFRAPCVVLAVGSPAAATRLSGADAGWVERAGQPCRVQCLDLGVAQSPEASLLLSMTEPLFSSTHAPVAKLAPPGRSLIGVMRYLAPRESTDRTTGTEQLRAHGCRQGIDADDIVFERYLHEMTAAHGSPTAGTERPRFNDVASRWMWIAGDWVGTDDGSIPLLADAAVASAAAAATDIVRRLEAAHG